MVLPVTRRKSFKKVYTHRVALKGFDIFLVWTEETVLGPSRANEGCSWALRLSCSHIMTWVEST